MKRQGPPRLAEWLIRTLVRDVDGQAWADELNELYGEDVRESGLLTATWRYWSGATSLVVLWSLHRVTGRRGWAGVTGCISHVTGALSHDVSRGLRGLFATPGFSAVVLLTLGLGVAATTLIFSVVYGVLIAPLPYPDPDRIVVLAEKPVASELSVSVSYPNALDWKERQTSLEAMALVNIGPLTLETEAGDRRVSAVFADSEYFSVFGGSAALGRVFRSDENLIPGGHPLAVLTDWGWQRLFEGDPSVVGTTIDLSGTPFTVIGILGPSYRDPFPGASGSRNDLVVPLMMAGQISQMGNDLFTSRRSRFFSAIGKLREGVTVAQGDAELGEIAARLAALHPVNSGMTATVASLDQQVTQQLRAPALVLLVGAVVLLAIACFNVANLLLVRGAGRRDELAVHVALGAGRLRLFRLLAIESGILALAGGGLGIAAAHIGLPAVLRLVPNQLPPTATVTVNLPVVLAALAVSLAAGVASGLVPAIRLSALDIRGALSGSGGVVGDRRGEGVRRALVVGEIATAMVLLATSVALVRSFQSVRVSDPGFVTENIVTVGINLPEATYGDEESMSLAARVLAERVGDAPGVEWAHVWGPGRPGLSFNFQTSVPDGAVVEAIAQAPLARRHSVTPGALEAMGIELVRGRTISPRDMADGPRVAVISESMAQALWPGQDPIGKRYHNFQPTGVSIPADRHWTVVGVVRDAQHGGRVARPGILLTTYDSYFPFTQRTSRSFTLLAKTGAEDQAAAVRDTIRAFDPNIAVLDMVTMADNFAQEESIARFAAQLMGAFGLASLVLAALGVYGVLTFAVEDRVREIGLRTALGASRSRMLLHFLGYGLSISGVGVVAGASSALLVAGTLKPAVPIAPEIDGIAVCTAGFALLFVALAAGAAPAVRASRVPPAAALRGE